MKLEQIGVDVLRRALELYLDLAHGENKPALLAKIGAAGFQSTSQALGTFIDESGRGSAAAGSRRYVLRLGNRRYPFMKFVLQEYLIENEFFFSVDTHDQMEIRSSIPDFEAWLEIKRFNRALKDEIESAWEHAGIPTFSDLQRLVQAGAGCSQDAKAASGRTVLVVDDERAIAETVATLLRGEGYSVVIAHDGAEALRRIQESCPDVILMDYEMPKMDGIQLCTTIRAIPAFRKVPILLATACSMDLSDVRAADGFLVKPYQKDILFSFIRHMLK
ncbi:MAG: response regulator [Planctomycetes bacterium]|nr:response regulator [Planctomycetota bacterium]MBI3844586.1 response regulator [Planctomycetota bacterium]